LTASLRPGSERDLRRPGRFLLERAGARSR
jgi:hypothetical protein